LKTGMSEREREKERERKREKEREREAKEKMKKGELKVGAWTHSEQATKDGFDFV
jgi:hypothetical protein